MKKILIVEDDLEVQSLYKQKLDQSGYTVMQAYTGQDGLDSVKSGLPDLIILDIMLPGGINGFDVLEQLKRDQQTASIPVFVLTNLDAEEETAKSLGVIEYIVKTRTSLEDVTDKIRKVLG